MNPNIFQVMVREDGEIKIITVIDETLERLKHDPKVTFLGYMENMFNNESVKKLH